MSSSSRASASSAWQRLLFAAVIVAGAMALAAEPAAAVPALYWKLSPPGVTPVQYYNGSTTVAASDFQVTVDSAYESGVMASATGFASSDSVATPDGSFTALSETPGLDPVSYYRENTANPDAINWLQNASKTVAQGSVTLASPSTSFTGTISFSSASGGLAAYQDNVPSAVYGPLGAQVPLIQLLPTLNLQNVTLEETYVGYVLTDDATGAIDAVGYSQDGGATWDNYTPSAPGGPIDFLSAHSIVPNSFATTELAFGPNIDLGPGVYDVTIGMSNAIGGTLAPLTYSFDSSTLAGATSLSAMVGVDQYFTPVPLPVPEPASIALAALGLAALAGA
ncbi:MAG: hypothetical protein ACREJ3_15030, partial [Polyangiaceae bacterium]